MIDYNLKFDFADNIIILCNSSKYIMMFFPLLNCYSFSSGYFVYIVDG